MQRNIIGMCFRAGPAGRSRAVRSMTTALHKRGQRAWQRAMRAGGPFAPGSVIGAVAADNHRRSMQRGGGAMATDEGAEGDQMRSASFISVEGSLTTGTMVSALSGGEPLSSAARLHDISRFSQV